MLHGRLIAVPCLLLLASCAGAPQTPIHAGGDTTEEIPLTRLIGPGVTIDVREACESDRDHLVGLADFEA